MKKTNASSEKEETAIAAPQVPAPSADAYKSITYDARNPAPIEQINELARDGWRLVTAVGDVQVTLFFERK
jgi:hypothetical protein